MKEILIIMFMMILWNAVMSIITKKGNNLYCGLIGFSGAGNADLNKLKMLMLSNIMRGDKGTGFYDGAGIQKDSTNAIEFLSKAKIADTRLFIGHTRQPTVGNAAITANCHPFEYGDTITAHNGTLTYLYPLARKYGIDTKDYDIDSQLLGQCLALPNDFSALQYIEGTASVLIHRKSEPDTLYCFRKSDERPLFRGKIGDDMYISSIEESLKLIGCESIKEFKVECLYKITNGKIIESKVRKHIPELKPKVVNRGTYEHDRYPYTDGHFSTVINSVFSVGDVAIMKSEFYAQKKMIDPSLLMYVYAARKDGITCNPITDCKLNDITKHITIKSNKSSYMSFSNDEVCKILTNSSLICRKGDYGITMVDLSYKFKDMTGKEHNVDLPACSLFVCVTDVSKSSVDVIILGENCMNVLSLNIGYVGFFYAAATSERLKDMIDYVGIEFTCIIEQLLDNKKNTFDYTKGLDSDVTTDSIISDEKEQAGAQNERETDWLDDEGFLSEAVTKNTNFDQLYSGTGVEYRELLDIYHVLANNLKPILGIISKKKKNLSNEEIKTIAKFLDGIGKGTASLRETILGMQEILTMEITPEKDVLPV